MTYQPPHTYAQWVELIDAFAQQPDNSAVVDAMKQGTLDGDLYVLERFLQHFIDAINTRLTLAQKRFIRTRSHQFTNAGAFTHSLIQLRRDYSKIYNAVKLPAIPSDIQDKLESKVKEFAQDSQKILLEGASGRRASLIRQNPVDRF